MEGRPNYQLGRVLPDCLGNESNVPELAFKKKLYRLFLNLGKWLKKIHQQRNELL